MRCFASQLTRPNHFEMTHGWADPLERVIGRFWAKCVHATLGVHSVWIDVHTMWDGIAALVHGL
ncbi:MAG: hypothetical protein DMG64_14870 [Acidobacteria bacterium]|nr:MAG: hypothetical protein DMG63_17745 [Acidobacteriota bacterium]PYY01257.1 MAG: hypothetical protein DMG64_14870 [Acidobacteriota bacterium]PYY23991.1 MAG: hypothetical protein DMG62_05990 [Acidobacteriota bacterium]